MGLKSKSQTLESNEKMKDLQQKLAVTLVSETPARTSLVWGL